MKQLLFMISLSLIACNHPSSPEGRSKLRDKKMQEEIDHLKDQNRAMLDSISLINKKIKQLK
ncbi:hypothetical protein [Sphingobacterium sp. LRF_L2]|uniref:hypothetical protein n=1 Tax=Sphingobacterium sp. LRF_L2 TaxID=3369421 RepID=UPI003F626D55